MSLTDRILNERSDRAVADRRMILRNQYIIMQALLSIGEVRANSQASAELHYHATRTQAYLGEER